MVAIIAILAAMLLPALQGARDSAKATHCMNNLKHIHLAAILYAGDNDDRLPDVCPALAIPYDHWMEILSKYLKVPPTPVEYPGSRSVSGFRYVMMCPATPLGTWVQPYGGSFHTGADGMNYGTDYAMNHNVAGGTRLGPSFAAGHKLSAIAKPAMLALFGDTEGLNGWCGFAYYTITPRHRNRTRANVACVDGHVESLKVPWPTYYTYYTRYNSELGVYYYPTYQPGPGDCGPGYKVYMSPVFF